MRDCAPVCELDPSNHLEELVPSCLLWFSAGHSASSYGALPPWYPVLSLNNCCFKKNKTVTFVNYRHLHSNSDLCGSWKKIF